MGQDEKKKFLIFRLTGTAVDVYLIEIGPPSSKEKQTNKKTQKTAEYQESKIPLKAGIIFQQQLDSKSKQRETCDRYRLLIQSCGTDQNQAHVSVNM